jgi:hypothetical protein
MSNAYSLNNYTAVVSLNERTIYFKITDTINYVSYEGNVDAKELRTNLELGDCYSVICKCFEQSDADYKTAVTTNSGTLKLIFNALVGGFLKIGFDVMLREKVMSNDGQLTLNFNRLEQKLNAGLEKAMAKCAELERALEVKTRELANITDNLGFAHICMTHSSHPQPHHFIPIGVREITNFQGSQDSNSFKFELVHSFYRLEKLVMNYCRISSFKAAQLKNKSLISLEIQSHNEGHLTSISGIEDMPELKSLIIRGAPGLTNVVSVLSSYEHKIKSLTFSGCQQVNVVEMQTYCQKNNIKLDIA